MLEDRSSQQTAKNKRKTLDIFTLLGNSCHTTANTHKKASLRVYTEEHWFASGIRSMKLLVKHKENMK
jgi:hypothetical protein